MSFTYSAGGTGRDYVRLLIGDTVAAAAKFQDEELDAFLTAESGDARMAAATALEAWATELSRQAIRYRVTGFELDRTKTADAMLATAKRLREEARAVPYEFESVLDHGISHYGEDLSNYPNTSDDGSGEPVL